MTLHVLDTDILTLFQDGHPNVCERARTVSQDAIAITVLSVEEQLSGWYTAVRKAKRPDQLAHAYRKLATSVRFLSRLHILDYTQVAMQRYEQLRKQKIRIGRQDLRSAAIVWNRARFWSRATRAISSRCRACRWRTGRNDG